MFSGEYEISMDDKGRLFVPARYREELGLNVVMWRGVDGQVMIYPRDVWQKVAEVLAKQETRQRVRQARWVVFSGIDVEMDKQGRIVIPPSLRRYAELGTDITVVGIDDHLEIWSQIRWDTLTRELLTEGGDIADQLADLGVRL